MSGGGSAKPASGYQMVVSLCIQLALWCFVGAAVALVAYGPDYHKDRHVQELLAPIVKDENVMVSLIALQAMIYVSFTVGFLPLVFALLVCLLFAIRWPRKALQRTYVISGFFMLCAFTLSVAGIACFTVSIIASDSWHSRPQAHERPFHDAVDLCGATNVTRNATILAKCDAVYDIQASLSCCGAVNFTDYMGPNMESYIPKSCCGRLHTEAPLPYPDPEVEVPQTNQPLIESELRECYLEGRKLLLDGSQNTTYLFTDGCYEQISAFEEKNIFQYLFMSGITAMACGFIVCLIMSIAICFAKAEAKRKLQEDKLGLLNKEPPGDVNNTMVTEKNKEAEKTRKMQKMKKKEEQKTSSPEDIESMEFTHL